MSTRFLKVFSVDGKLLLTYLLLNGKIISIIGGVNMGLEKISEYKKKLNLTTEELSERSGVPIGTLNKILSGATKDPKLETLKAIAKVLGLSLNDFDDYNEPQTIAAHFDGDEYTEDELEEIKQFAEFVKNRKK